MTHLEKTSKRGKREGIAPLESVLCTEQLSRRPARTPDYERENNALLGLSQALADSPRTILQTLTDAILEVLHADSAGISFLTSDEKMFHWPAIAGVWKSHVGAGAPRDFSPCGDVLDSNAALLFRHPERRYTYLQSVLPQIEECLLVPFHVHGRAVGTIWAVDHGARGHFDAEDLRQLFTLSRFASAAHQVAATLETLDAQNQSLRDNQIHLFGAFAQLEAANSELVDSRGVALNLAEAAVRSRRETEAVNVKLGLSEERYRTLFDMGPMAVCSSDDQGVITDFNTRAVELWGRSPAFGENVEQFRRSFKFFRPDGTPVGPEQCPIEGVVNGMMPELSGEELLIERPDGSRIVVVATVQPQKDSQGSTIGAISSFYDISKRKQAEEAQARLAAIVESSEDAIIGNDIKGIITSWNVGAERLFGYHAREAMGQHATVLLPMDRFGEEAAIQERIRRAETVENYETVRLRKDGTQFDASVTVSSIHNNQGVVIGSATIARDITARKRGEQALREADRHKNEFLAILAHELRNPLASIVVSMDILGRMRSLEGTESSRLRSDGSAGDPDRGDAADLALAVLRRQVGQVARLVDDLLDAGRISSGKIELRRERVEVSSFIHQAAEVVRPLCYSLGHELTVTVPSDPVYVFADPTRLAQIISNLLTNACKFTAQLGRVWLTLECQERNETDEVGGLSSRSAHDVVIRVCDTGIGIAANQRERIFEMFAQGDVSLERPLAGLGIGLTLVKTLVELHGGTVEVYSAGVGQGAEFAVRLPGLVAADSPDSLCPITRTESIAPLRILIVEDDRDAADMLAMLLRMDGHTADVVHDGLAAVEAVGRVDFDVILLDIGLPGLNGYETAREIRKQSGVRHPALVALSGWGQDDDRRRSIEAGFDAHVVKPVDGTALGRLLSRIGALHTE